jgi:nanoRNase/pAp phosphatase (c-di-AMP/oligoRNAs hydrolase)
MRHDKTVQRRITAGAQRILRFLERGAGTLSPLLILTHDFPDPDALASAYALQYLAKTEFGITSRIAYGGIIGRMENRMMVKVLKMPVYRLRPRDLKAYARIATVDTQPAFENNSFPVGRRAALVIDQHPSDTPPDAELAVVDETCGATSVILARCLLRSGARIPPGLATALAYGIISDTQNFYRCYHPAVFDTYLKVLEHSDLELLVRIQNPPRPKAFFTTLGKGMYNASVKGRLVTSHLGEVRNPDLVSLATDFLLGYQGIAWSFCTGRYKGKLYFSLRGAQANFPAGEILRDICERRGQAGGHDTIAGGSLGIPGVSGEEAWQKAEQGLMDRLTRRLGISAKSRKHHPFREGAERTL